MQLEAKEELARFIKMSFKIEELEEENKKLKKENEELEEANNILKAILGSRRNSISKKIGRNIGNE